MGFIAEIIKSFRSTTSDKGSAFSGQFRGYKDDTFTGEVYVPSGFYSTPTPGSLYYIIEANNNPGHLIGLNQNNYKLNLIEKPGEAGIFATDPNGDNIVVRQKFSINGKYALGNSSEELSILMNDLIGVLIGIIVDINTGILLPTVAAQLTVIQSRFADLLEPL